MFLQARGLFLFFRPFIFIHFGLFPLHHFLNILQGTLLVCYGRSLGFWIKHGLNVLLALNSGGEHKDSRTFAPGLFQPEFKTLQVAQWQPGKPTQRENGFSGFWKEFGKETLHQTASDFFEMVDLKKINKNVDPKLGGTAKQSQTFENQEANKNKIKKI